MYEGCALVGQAEKRMSRDLRRIRQGKLILRPHDECEHKIYQNKELCVACCLEVKSTRAQTQVGHFDRRGYAFSGVLLGTFAVLARQVVTVALRVSGEGGERRAGNTEHLSDSVSRRQFAYAGCTGPGPLHMRVCKLLCADGGSCSWCWLSRAGSDTVSVACVL